MKVVKLYNNDNIVNETKRIIVLKYLTFTVDRKDSFNIGEAFNKERLDVLFKFEITLHKIFQKVQ